MVFIGLLDLREQTHLSLPAVELGVGVVVDCYYRAAELPEMNYSWDSGLRCPPLCQPSASVAFLGSLWLFLCLLSTLGYYFLLIVEIIFSLWQRKRLPQLIMLW